MKHEMLRPTLLCDRFREFRSKCSDMNYLNLSLKKHVSQHDCGSISIDMRSERTFVSNLCLVMVNDSVTFDIMRVFLRNQARPAAKRV